MNCLQRLPRYSDTHVLKYISTAKMYFNVTNILEVEKWVKLSQLTVTKIMYRTVKNVNDTFRTKYTVQERTCSPDTGFELF